MALLIGPVVALIGVLAAYFVLRTRARSRASLYSSRRTELQRVAAARRRHALDPHAGKGKGKHAAAEPPPAYPPLQPAGAPEPRAGDAWDSSPTRTAAAAALPPAAAAAAPPQQFESSAPVEPPPAPEPPAPEPVEPPPPEPVFVEPPVPEPVFVEQPVPEHVFVEPPAPEPVFVEPPAPEPPRAALEPVFVEPPAAEPVPEAPAPAPAEPVAAPQPPPPPPPPMESDWSVSMAPSRPPAPAPGPTPVAQYLPPAEPLPAPEGARESASPGPADGWESASPAPVDASDASPVVPEAAAAVSPSWELASESSHDAKSSLQAQPIPDAPESAAAPGGWSIIGEGGTMVAPGDQPTFRASKRGGKDRSWDSGIYGDEPKVPVAQTVLGYVGLVAALVVVLLGVILMISATR